jgi:hypothetical protein
MCICKDILLRSSTKLNKRFQEFMIETLLLYIVIPKRINFLQLGRYSSSSEQRFRQNYSKHFDWMSFNSELSKDVLTGKRKAIAIDPSFISKSGKKTPYIGRFWSGCNGKAMRGLEILGVGLIDIDNKYCLSLFAVQTPSPKALHVAEWTLVDWYLFALEKKKEALLKLTSYVVADAWFAKQAFYKGLNEMGFHLVSRFRDDAYLMYPTKEQRTGKKGRPKKFDGKVDLSNLDYSRFEKLDIQQDGNCYTAILFSKSLNATVRVVIWQSADKKSHKIYFTTDLNMSGKDVIETYRTRFQIEFNYRDAKQHAGLCNSQSRNLDRLDFNFNASLTSINLAKAYAMKIGKPFSMVSIKTMMHNAFLLERFIAVSGIRPNRNLNDRLFKELIEFAVIAA